MKIICDCGNEIEISKQVEPITVKINFHSNDSKKNEIGSMFRMTKERIQQMDGKSLRKLFHPERSQKLRDFLCD